LKQNNKFRYTRKIFFGNTKGEHFETSIARQIQVSRYASASKVVREGLRLLEERETKLLALHQALKKGEDSGRADYSLTGLIDELDRENLN